MYNKHFQSILNKLLSSRESPADSAIFLTRLGADFPSFMESFQFLYSNHPSYEKSLEKFISIITHYHNKRSRELKELDSARERESGWYLKENMTGMMLYIDRFNKDIKGLIEKIDYFEELGVNLIHLMPFFKPREGENDGGYAVSDYLSVREDFGSNEDLYKFINICRGRGISVAADMVLNHTSDTHQWALNAKSGDKKYIDYYYTYEDRVIPDMFEKTMPEVFPDNAPGNFTYSHEMKRWVMTVFHNYQWDLNFTNPDVFLEILTVLLEYANYGIDIIRLDAVAFLWKRIGTASQNEKEAHIILQGLKAAVEIVSPAVIFIAEAIVSPDEIVKYFGTGKMEARECDIAYNASFMVSIWDALATQNCRLTKNGIRHTPVKPFGTTWLSYARCHDDIGLGFSDRDAETAGYSPFKHRKFLQKYYTGKFEGSISSGELFMYNPLTEDARISGTLASLAGLETALRKDDDGLIDTAVSRIILIHSMLMSVGGIPMLYYGDEVGTLNDYSYLNNEQTSCDNRWMHRPFIDWNKAEKRKEKGTVEYRIFNALKKIIEIRKTISEFGDYNNMSLIDYHSDRLFIYAREYAGKKTIVVNNVSSVSQILDEALLFENGLEEYKDAAGVSKTEIIDGKIIIPPYGFLWLR